MFDKKCWYQENKERLRLKRREYRAAHRELTRQQEKGQRDRLRLRVLTHYSNGTPICAHCGITDVDLLTIDHIEGGGHQHRRLIGGLRGGNLVWWLRKEGFPEGYQILCANCNLKKYKQEKK